MNWKWIVILILFILVVIFTAQNYEVVEIKFLFWTLRMSRSIIIFLSVLVGTILGISLSVFGKKKSKP